ncbi:MAG: NADH-quinone oxidoreductase subunit A [Candidatus Comchoanobacterales bacterium]
MLEYLNVLIFGGLALIIGVAPMVLGYLCSPSNLHDAKQEAYECGFSPVGDARKPFDLRYYLVAILFILFDLETAFLFPWAVTFRELGWLGLLSMGLFLGVLTIGFFYEWRKGALTWQ